MCKCLVKHSCVYINLVPKKLEPWTATLSWWRHLKALKMMQLFSRGCPGYPRQIDSRRRAKPRAGHYRVINQTKGRIAIPKRREWCVGGQPDAVGKRSWVCLLNGF